MHIRLRMDEAGHRWVGCHVSGSAIRLSLDEERYIEMTALEAALVGALLAEAAEQETAAIYVSFDHQQQFGAAGCEEPYDIRLRHAGRLLLIGCQRPCIRLLASMLDQCSQFADDYQESQTDGFLPPHVRQLLKGEVVDDDRRRR